MKQITIVGAGMSAVTLTAEGRLAVEEADTLIGAPRLLAEFKSLGKPAYAAYAPEAVAQILAGYKEGRFCILVSGDTGFYSAAEGLAAALEEYAPVFIPGISSLSYFFARLKRPWQEAALLSCHGRKSNVVEAVRRNPLTFILTGDNLAELGQTLLAAGFGDLTAYTGENLGLPEERLLKSTVSRLAEAESSKLAVLLVENPAYTRRIPCGIPDHHFIRGNVPMTKAEIRAVTLSKLALAPRAVCCDIGAGTGSVTVEMALAAYEGQVYALDHNSEANRLIAANCRAFHISNVIPLPEAAPEGLKHLPPLDAAFIGGSTGKIGEIFPVLLAKNPCLRLVINAVTLETLAEAKAAFQNYGMEAEIIQISLTKANPRGQYRMLQAHTPVFILSGGGNG